MATRMTRIYTDFSLIEVTKALIRQLYEGKIRVNPRHPRHPRCHYSYVRVSANPKRIKYPPSVPPHAHPIHQANDSFSTAPPE